MASESSAASSEKLKKKRGRHCKSFGIYTVSLHYRSYQKTKESLTKLRFQKYPTSKLLLNSSSILQPHL